jgi:hypothetical protein
MRSIILSVLIVEKVPVVRQVYVVPRRTPKSGIFMWPLLYCLRNFEAENQESSDGYLALYQPE